LIASVTFSGLKKLVGEAKKDLSKEALDNGLELSKFQLMFVKLYGLSTILNMCRENHVRLVNNTKNLESPLTFRGDADAVFQTQSDIEQLLTPLQCPSLIVNLRTLTPPQRTHLRQVGEAHKVLFFYEQNGDYILSLDSEAREKALKEANSISLKERTISLSATAFPAWKQVEQRTRSEFPTITFHSDGERQKVTLKGADEDELARAESVIDQVNVGLVTVRMNLSETDTDLAAVIPKQKIKEEDHLADLRLDTGSFVIKGVPGNVSSAQARIRSLLESMTSVTFSTTIHARLDRQLDRHFRGKREIRADIGVDPERNTVSVTLRGTPKAVTEARLWVDGVSTKTRRIPLNSEEILFVKQSFKGAPAEKNVNMIASKLSAATFLDQSESCLYLYGFSDEEVDKASTEISRLLGKSITDEKNWTLDDPLKAKFLEMRRRDIEQRQGVTISVRDIKVQVKGPSKKVSDALADLQELLSTLNSRVVTLSTSDLKQKVLLRKRILAFLTEFDSPDLLYEVFSEDKLKSSNEVARVVTAQDSDHQEVTRSLRVIFEMHKEREVEYCDSDFVVVKNLFAARKITVEKCEREYSVLVQLRDGPPPKLVLFGKDDDCKAVSNEVKELLANNSMKRETISRGTPAQRRLYQLKVSSEWPDVLPPKTRVTLIPTGFLVDAITGLFPQAKTQLENHFSGFASSLRTMDIPVETPLYK